MDYLANQKGFANTRGIRSYFFHCFISMKFVLKSYLNNSKKFFVLFQLSFYSQPLWFDMMSTMYLRWWWEKKLPRTKSLGINLCNKQGNVVQGKNWDAGICRLMKNNNVRLVLHSWWGRKLSLCPMYMFVIMCVISSSKGSLQDQEAKSEKINMKASFAGNLFLVWLFSWMEIISLQQKGEPCCFEEDTSVLWRLQDKSI